MDVKDHTDQLHLVLGVVKFHFMVSTSDRSVRDLAYEQEARDEVLIAARQLVDERAKGVRLRLKSLVVDALDGDLVDDLDRLLAVGDR